MAEVRYKEVELSKLFKNKRGNSNYTKKYCNDNKGEYEVYTGTTIGSFGFINTYDYDEPLLTYTTDGENAATIKILSGKYNVGGHRAILFPKDENIIIDYFKWTLQKLFFDNVKKGDVPSITWSRIKDLEVTVPIDKNGNYDIEKQKEIVKKYEIVEEKKQELKEKLDYFKDVQVDFSNEINVETKEITFDDLFDIERGKVISRKYIENNKGEYPVFSTQIDSSFGYIDSYMYDGEYLIWNTDGLGGYIRRVDGKFSITNIVGIMKLKEIYKDSVDLEYIRRILEPIFRENVKGREGVGGKNEYTKINSTMIKNLDIKINIPINEDGTFDLEKQNQIVSKYKAIEEMKKSILEKGLPFTLSNVQFDGETPYIYIYIG